MARNWRPQTEELKLPSGRDCIVRKPSVMQVVAKHGRVPASFSPQLLADANATGTAPEMAPDDLRLALSMADDIVELALVDPRIVPANPDYEAGECLLVDVTFEDKLHIFTWGMGAAEAEEAVTFPRSGRKSGVDAAPAGEAVRDDAK